MLPNLNILCILSCTVPELLHIIGQIFAFNKRYTLVQDEPLNPGPRNLASKNMKHRSIVRY